MSSDSDLPRGFWWHTDPETGVRQLRPKMTLETLAGPPPYPEGTIFRCTFCNMKGTAKELEQKFCTDPEAYHGGQLRPRRPTSTLGEHTKRACRQCGQDARGNSPWCSVSCREADPQST